MLITATHLFFYKTKESYSNFYKTSFSYKGHTFETSEQAFMWCKAIHFNDMNTANALLEMGDDPMGAKMLGRMVQGYDEYTWDSVREQYMYEVCLEKYKQNADIRQQILDTGDLHLVEASPTDKIWGIGLDEKSPDIYIESKWKGRNLLGKVLMQVREQIKSEA